MQVEGFRNFKNTLFDMELSLLTVRLSYGVSNADEIEYLVEKTN